MDKQVKIMNKVVALVKELEMEKDYSAQEDYEGNLMNLPDFSEVVNEDPDKIIFAVSYLSGKLFHN